MAPDVSFFVACLNEEDNIVATLETVHAVMAGREATYEVLVVDDASSDGTVKQVEDHRSAHPDRPVTLIRNARTSGLGHNYRYAASLAAGTYFMLVNGDNDTSKKTLSDILGQMGNADMIVPYVANQGARGFFRAAVSWMFTALVNLIAGRRLRYYNGPVLHLRETVNRFRPVTAGSAYQAEILVGAMNGGLTYREVPFDAVVRPRNKTTSFDLRNVLSVAISLWGLSSDRVRGRFAAGKGAFEKA